LKSYYGESIEEHLSERIDDIREEASKTMHQMLIDYNVPKQSMDKHYGHYVKRHPKLI
jgi:hypothetical protein